MRFAFLEDDTIDPTDPNSGNGVSFCSFANLDDLINHLQQSRYSKGRCKGIMIIPLDSQEAYERVDRIKRQTSIG